MDDNTSQAGTKSQTQNNTNRDTTQTNSDPISSSTNKAALPSENQTNETGNANPVEDTFVAKQTTKADVATVFNNETQATQSIQNTNPTLVPSNNASPIEPELSAKQTTKAPTLVPSNNASPIEPELSAKQTTKADVATVLNNETQATQATQNITPTLAPSNNTSPIEPELSAKQTTKAPTLVPSNNASPIEPELSAKQTTNADVDNVLTNITQATEPTQNNPTLMPSYNAGPIEPELNAQPTNIADVESAPTHKTEYLQPTHHDDAIPVPSLHTDVFQENINPNLMNTLPKFSLKATTKEENQTENLDVATAVPVISANTEAPPIQMTHKSSKAGGSKSDKAATMPQANLSPGFGGGMMLMSRPGQLPVFSKKPSSKANNDPTANKPTEAVPQANLAPGFGGGGFMLMSRPGQMPVFSRKKTSVKKTAPPPPPPKQKTAPPPPPPKPSVKKEPEPQPKPQPSKPASNKPASNMAQKSANPAPSVKPENTKKESKIEQLKRTNMKTVVHDRKRCLIQCDSLFGGLISTAEQNSSMILLIVFVVLAVLSYLAYQRINERRISEGYFFARCSLVITVLSGTVGVYILNLGCWGIQTKENMKRDKRSKISSSGQESIVVQMKRATHNVNKSRKILYTEANSSNEDSELLFSNIGSFKEEALSHNKPCNKIGFRLKMLATAMIGLGGIGLYVAGFQTMEHSQISKETSRVATKETVLFLVGWVLIVISLYGFWKTEPKKAERVTSL